MKILLSNDDGVRSEGLRVLAETLMERHTVCVAAPDCERSAVSRGMTLFNPLRADALTLPGLPDVPAYAVSGTPVDCVRLGLGNLFPEAKIVVSGINHGSNVGTDVLYSGTVGAAHEAALLGLQAIAISTNAFRPTHFETAARAAMWAIDYVEKHPLPFGTVLNINAPDLPFDQIRGVRKAPTSVVQYTLKYIEREDPAGRKYYWPPRGRISNAKGLDLDERWLTDGYIVFTPLTYDLTDSMSMATLELADFPRE